MAKSKEKVQEVAAKKASVRAPGPETHMNTSMYKNRVSLPDEVKKQVVKKMQVTLASATDMYSQSKFAHWNWSARLELCQWIRETLDKESIWDEARSTSLSRW